MTYDPRKLCSATDFSKKFPFFRPKPLDISPSFAIFYINSRLPYMVAAGKKGDICMKSTGIVRKVDELGRIVLPIELRRTLDIAEKDALEIYVDGSAIVMKKYQPACIFCDDASNIITYKGKNICRSCIQLLEKQL